VTETKTTLVWLLQDKVSAAAAKMEHNLNRAGQSAKSNGGLIGKLSNATGGLINPFTMAAAAVGVLTVGLGVALDKAAKHEVVTARLTQTLKANIPAWHGSREALDAYIESQTNAGFTVEETTASLAQLITATKSVAKAQEAQSAAMNLARLKGISLQDATDAITKVEGGRYRILASLGIVMAKGATQTQVLAEIQRRAGGQADAYGKTTAGAFAKINAKIDAATEKIGAALLPVLAALAGFFADVLIPAIEKVVGVFVTLIGRIQDAINWLGNFNKTAAVNTAAAAAYQAGQAGGRFAGRHRAFGGPVEPGGVYTVGEHGPETLVMGSRTGNVLPHGAGFSQLHGVTLVGISEREIVEMVDRGLYFKLQRAAPTLGRT